jgi:hypothetical protein
MASGIASVMPILFLAISAFVLIDPSSVGRVFGISSRNNGNGETKNK